MYIISFLDRFLQSANVPRPLICYWRTAWVNKYAFWIVKHISRWGCILTSFYWGVSKYHVAETCTIPLKASHESLRRLWCVKEESPYQQPSICVTNWLTQCCNCLSHRVFVLVVYSGDCAQMLPTRGWAEYCTLARYATIELEPTLNSLTANPVHIVDTRYYWMQSMVEP